MLVGVGVGDGLHSFLLELAGVTRQQGLRRPDTLYGWGVHSLQEAPASLPNKEEGRAGVSQACAGAS